MFHLSLPMFAVAVAVALAPAGRAQFDTNGPNAALRMQGVTASAEDPITHDVAIPIPGAFFFDITSGASPGMGVILLASAVNPVGPQFSTPFWGGSIDVGSFASGPSSILIVADGIALSVNPAIDFNYRTSVPGVSGGPIPTYTQSVAFTDAALCGFRAAIQAVVQDPTNGPFGVDNTEVADANFREGREATLLTGDDGIVNVAFGAGRSFPFHGVNYTDFWVCGNGYVSFAGPTTVQANGFTIDAGSWVTAEPSIACCINDWSPGQTGPNDGVYYREVSRSATGGFESLISWGDRRGLPSGALGMESFASPGSVNRFELVLNGQAAASACNLPAAAPGEFRLRWPLLDPQNLARPGDGVFGQTPGSPAIAMTSLPSSNDLLGQIVTTGANAASVEEHDNNGLNQSVLGTGPMRTPRLYNNFYAASGLEVVFTPTPGAGIPGGAGYTSTPSAPPEDDVEGIVGSLVTTAGSITTLVGKFFGFGAGTVAIVDSAGTISAGIPATVIGGTGPLFANEGLVFATPLLAVGPATITVNFASGFAESVNTFALDPCLTVSQFTLPNNGFITFGLAAPPFITHYGATYAQLSIGSNGIITFGGGTALFASTPAAFFNGIGGIPNAAVAALWADLNLGGSGSGAIYSVIENLCTGTVQVDFASQNYAISGSPAGSFRVTFGIVGPDSIRFDYSQLLDDPANADTAVVGLSDGLVGPGFIKTDLATLGGIETVIPGYVSALPQESVAEDMPTGTVGARLRTINGTGIFTTQIIGGIVTAF